MHGAGTALRKAAAEPRLVQPDVVAECVERRHVRVDVHAVDLAVDDKQELLPHVCVPSPTLSAVTRAAAFWAAAPIVTTRSTQTSMTTDGNNELLVVDGRQWQEGQTAADIAARRAPSMATVMPSSSTACRPMPVSPMPSPKMSRTFAMEKSRCVSKAFPAAIDQGAGILFNLKPNGDYLTVRANPLDNNLVLWKFEKDGRSSVKWIRDTRRHHANGTTSGSGSPAPRSKVTSTASFIWSTIYLERVGGRIGLWSKADSQMHLDDYTLTPAAMSPKDMQRAVLGPCVQGAA